MMAPCLAAPPVLAAKGPAKSLSLYNSHTDESLGVAYSKNGCYVPEALQKIDHLFRDYRTGDIKPIDPRLLDYLHAISKSMKLTPQNPFHVISAYRSPRTNALLRRRSRKVAKNSYHMRGMAVDIRLPGYRTSSLRKAARRLRLGGVGYYPGPRFVHIDLGKARTWSSGWRG